MVPAAIVARRSFRVDLLRDQKSLAMEEMQIIDNENRKTARFIPNNFGQTSGFCCGRFY